MILFALHLDDQLVGLCSTECTTDKSPVCNCVCHGHFHGVQTDLAIYTLLAAPRSLLSALSKSHPEKSVKITIDYPALLDWLRERAQPVTIEHALDTPTN